MSFRIDLSKTTDLLSRYHRQFMEAGQAACLGTIRDNELPEPMVRSACEQWAGRAVASYYAMAQNSDLNQRLITLGGPVEVLAGGLQSLEDSYRTMTNCARLSRSLSHSLVRGLDEKETRRLNSDHFVLFRKEPDPLVGLYMTALVHFGFSFTLSIPIFDALGTIVTDDAISDVCLTIAANLEDDSEYGWALLQWLNSRLNDSQHTRVRQVLPEIMAVFERRCFGNPQTLETLAGSEIIVEQQEQNLGTLTNTQHAAIFYHTMTETIFPKLQDLGIDAPSLWRQHYRLDLVRAEAGMGIVAIDIV